MQFPPRGRIHCVGIKGAGMAGLAVLLKQRGYTVCGSDVADPFSCDEQLRASGIPVESWSGEHVERVDVVVYSTAYTSAHEELVHAHAAGVPLFSLPEVAGYFFNTAQGVAVCGSHGKTTTSGMITYMLTELGFDPTALVGAPIIQYRSSARSGASNFFILEADEYQNKFQWYRPKVLLITNIDYDHPDFFPTPQAYRDVFTQFVVSHKDAPVIACWDDPGVRACLSRVDAKRIITYGWDPAYQYSATHYRMENGRRTFTFSRHGQPIGDFSLSLIGRHHVSNALAALAACDVLVKPNLEHAARVLGGFEGMARRFQTVGTRGHMRIIDDYGHHPTEIRETLHAARHQFPNKKIWCVFGPHTYSRTQALLSQFGDSFHHVDRALILDIYPSAREQSAPLTGKDVVSAINQASDNALYVPTHDDAYREILEHAGEIDILITMGAGDVNALAYRLVDSRV